MDYCVLVRICCNLFQRKTENFMKENLRSFSFRSLSNKSIKSIANYRNRSKSIITKTRVIDFYRIPIVIDWLVSITIDYVRFLSSIENIDLLRPGSHWRVAFGCADCCWNTPRILITNDWKHHLDLQYQFTVQYFFQELLLKMSRIFNFNSIYLFPTSKSNQPSPNLTSYLVYITWFGETSLIWTPKGQSLLSYYRGWNFSLHIKSILRLN